MKKLVCLMLVTISFNSFAYTVIDSMYEQPEYSFSEREPASNSGKYCIVDEDLRTFGKSCYSTEALCSQRLEFWKDLPGVKDSKCVKI